MSTELSPASFRDRSAWARPPLEMAVTPVLFIADSTSLYPHWLATDPDQAYHCLTAADDQSGLELWRSHTPHLVIIEITVPQAAGWQWLTAIAAATPTRHPLPVLAIVAPGAERLALQAMKLGVVDYAIQTELTADHFRQTVRCTCDRLTQITHSAAAQTLATQPDFNHLLVEITSRFVDLSPDQLDSEIQRTLQLIGEITQMDRSYLIKFDDGADTMSITHEWNQPSIPAQIHLAQQIPCAAFPWSMAQLQQRQVLAVPDISALPACAAIDQASWQQFNFVAILSIPLIRKSQVTGLLGFVSLTHPVTWSEATIRVLQVLGQTIANAQQQAEDERRLAQSELWFRQAIVNAPYPLILHAEDGTILQINAAWTELTGYDLADIPTMAAWTARAYGTERHQVQSQIDRLYQLNTRVRDGEFTIRTKTGAARIWDFSSAPLGQLPDGRRVVLSMAADITDRHQTELALAASEARLSTLISNLPGYVYRVKPDADYAPEFLSQGVLAMTGYPPDAYFSGQIHHSQLMHPDDYDEVDHLIQTAIATQQPYECEYRIRTATGQEKWVWERGRGLYAEDATLQCLEGFVTDISDRKQAELLLRRYERIVSATPDCVSLVDRHYIYQVVNQTYALWHHKPCEDIVGHSVAELLGHEFFVARSQPYLDRCLAGTPQQAEAWQNYPNGEQRFVRITYAPYFEPNGTVSGVVVNVHDLTELKQAAEALSSSEARWQFALEGSGDGVWDWCLPTQKIFYSQRWKSILGYTDAEIGDDITEWSERVHPSDFAEYARRLEAHFQGASLTCEHEYRLRCKDGQYKWILDRGKVVEWAADGSPQRMIGTHTDITTRKQAEAELQDMSDRLRLAVRAAKMGIWDWDLVTDRLVWDDRIYELFGRQATDFSGTYAGWEATLHPDDLLRCRASTAHILTGDSDGQLEYRVVWPDGSIHYIESYALLQRDATGQPCRMIGVNLDITDRKMTQAALELNEERLRLALAATNQGLYDLNILTGVVIVTPEYALMLGYDPTTFVETPSRWRDRLHPEDQEHVYALYQAYVRGEVPEYAVEFRQRTASGAWKWIFSTGKIVAWDEAGQPLRMLGTHTDISDRKAAEAEIHEQKELLQTTFDHLPLMVGVYSAEGKPLILNRELERVIGWQKDEYNQVEEVLRTCYPDPADYQRVLAHIIRADSTWQDFETTVRDGRILDTTWAQIRLSDGRRIAIGQDITARKQAAKALQESEARFRAFMDNSPAAAWIMNSETNQVEYVNSTYYRLYKVATANVIGQPLDQIFPPDIAAIYTQNTRQVARSGRVLEAVEPGWRTDSSPGEFLVLKFPMPHTEGPQLVGGFAIDITDRKRAELALAESQQQFQNLVENSPDIIERFDLELRHLYVSPTLTRLTGIATHTFLGKSCRDLNLSGPMVEAWEAAAARLKATGRKQLIEFDTATLEGVRSFEMAIVPEYSVSGQLESILCISRDVTDRKQAELALAESQQQFQNLVENSPDIIERFDLNLRRLYVSPVLTELTGIPVQAMLGKTCREIRFDETIVNLWEAAAQRLLQTGDRQVIEFDLLTLAGIHTFEMVIVPELSSQGTLESILAISRDVTMLKQAALDRLQAQQLRLELSLLEQVLDVILAGYWDWDIPNHTNYWSPGLKRMFGYADADLPNSADTWQKLIFPEDLPIALDCYQRHVESHGVIPYYNEVRYRHKDGSTVWVICSGQVIEWDEAGNPLRMIGCHVDITRRKEIEAQWQKSEVHLRMAQRIAKLGSWEFNLITGQITWSDEVFHLFGLDPAAGPPANFAALQALFHPDDRDRHDATVRAAMTQGLAYDDEFRIYQPDGTLVYIQVKGEVRRSPTGEVIQMIGTVLDITERKEAEIALRQSEATIRALISAIPDLLIWIDQQGTYLNVLGSGSSIKLSQPLWFQPGANIYDILPPAQAQERMHYVQAALATNSLQVYEYQIEIEGELREEEARVVVCGEGEVLCMVRDITDRKRAETQLLQTTAQLTASNRELEAFSYSVSHDLRAPLRAIDGFSKALLEDYGDRFDADGLDYFERIRRNVQRMGMLIDDLLRLSRVSRSEMTYTTVNLSQIVQEQIQDLQATDPDRTVEVIIAPEAIVVADHTLMQVVLSNLVQNAWKFTSHHATARIEFGIIKRDGQPVYFVRDDGAGFDMAYAAMLFGVFQRLHNTNEFPGTGIGLATVQRAIHRHGGQVWAEAAIEQGATIYFTVPSTPTRLSSSAMA